MQTNLPMYACTTWFSTTDMFQDVHMPFIYTLQERLILLWQIKNKNKQIYCIYLCSLHMDMIWFIYIYIDIDISFTSIYKPRFNDIKNMCHTVPVNVTVLHLFCWGQHSLPSALWRRIGFTQRPCHHALVRRTRLEVMGTLIAARQALEYGMAGGFGRKFVWAWSWV